MSSVITVEIAGQRYPIRSGLDERYVTELAAYVDQKMRAASDSAPASDMLGLAVLVALNIADEFFREREREREVRPPTGDLQERAVRLERIVDEALAQVAARHGV
jgi:cell division protein ZapA